MWKGSFSYVWRNVLAALYAGMTTTTFFSLSNAVVSSDLSSALDGLPILPAI